MNTSCTGEIRRANKIIQVTRRAEFSHSFVSCTTYTHTHSITCQLNLSERLNCFSHKIIFHNLSGVTENEIYQKVGRCWCGCCSKYTCIYIRKQGTQEKVIEFEPKSNRVPNAKYAHTCISNDGLKSILHIVGESFTIANLSIFGFCEIPFRFKSWFCVFANCFGIQKILQRNEILMLMHNSQSRSIFAYIILTSPCSDCGSATFLLHVHVYVVLSSVVIVVGVVVVKETRRRRMRG